MSDFFQRREGGGIFILIFCPFFAHRPWQCHHCESNHLWENMNCVRSDSFLKAWVKYEKEVIELKCKLLKLTLKS